MRRGRKHLWRGIFRGLGRGACALLFLIAIWVGRILDLADRPDQLEKLEKLVGRIMADPRVHAVATAIADVLIFLHHWWAQTALGICALVLLFWSAPSFRRWRRRMVFHWRRLMEPEVWVERGDALQILAESSWGKIRRPSGNIFEHITALPASGMTKYQKEMAKFWHFMSMTLDSFEESNPKFIKIVDGKKLYLEEKLRLFARHALDEETIQQFGTVPRLIVE